MTPRPPVSRYRRNRTAGFTIVEVAMATCVMALGIATSVVAMQTGFRSLDLARGTTLASQIIQSEMERIRLMPWNNTSTVAVDSVCELPEKEAVDLATMFDASSRTATLIASNYQVVRVVENDATRPSDVKFITVYVTWKTYDGRSHTRSTKTMYAKNGLYDYFYTVAH
jgi:Tfp pilus assembly protein PilV